MKIDEINIFDDFATVKDETVLQATKIMKKKNVPDLVLIDDDNKPIGIVSSEDIIFKIIAEEKNPSETSISSIARTVKTFSQDATTKEVFDYMMESDNEIVPIIKEDGTLLGVCTITDVAWEDED